MKLQLNCSFRKFEIKGMHERMIPIYQFESINGIQRKRFVEENISFLIYEKEIHICAR